MPEPSCTECGPDAVMISAIQAIDVCSVTSREIHRLVEHGQIHFMETTGGRLFVCVASLMKTTSQ